MDQNNGGIIGKINTPTTTVASGVWSLDSQFESQSGSTWPLAFPQTTIANSCRFDDATSDYLTKTPSGAGSRTTWTWSAWIKRSDIGPTTGLFEAYDDSSNFSYIRFSPDYIRILNYIGGSANAVYNTTALFRDVSAWYHIVWTWDTTNGTAADRSRLYVNGTRITSFSTETNPTSGEVSWINNTDPHYIGSTGQPSLYMNGYMAEVIFVDGQALEQTSFGVFNPVTNIWEPRPYAGTYGTNGFRLDFADSSALGNDVSGNNNDYTPNNLTSIDQSTDTCSNNFATLNPLDKGYTGTIVLSEGNTTTEVSSGAGDYGLRSTIGVTTGKWYLEAKISTSNTLSIGDIDARLVFSMIDSTPPDDFYGVQRYSDTQTNIHDDGSYSQFNTSMWGGITSSDIISFAVDLDNNKIFLAKNGSFKDQSGNTGDPANGTNPTFTISDATKTYTFYTELRGNDANGTLVNFGNPPFTISSGNADANGFGNFEYAVPSGFLALCTKNLAENG